MLFVAGIHHEVVRGSPQDAQRSRARAVIAEPTPQAAAAFQSPSGSENENRDPMIMACASIPPIGFGGQLMLAAQSSLKPFLVRPRNLLRLSMGQMQSPQSEV